MKPEIESRVIDLMKELKVEILVECSIAAELKWKDDPEAQRELFEKFCRTAFIMDEFVQFIEYFHKNLGVFKGLVTQVSGIVERHTKRLEEIIKEKHDH